VFERDSVLALPLSKVNKTVVDTSGGGNLWVYHKFWTWKSSFLVSIKKLESFGFDGCDFL